MATEREFKLVGSFDDQITKKLKKINSEVGKLSKSFDKFNKRLAPVTKGMNKFADSSMRANKALKEQKVGFESSLQSARQYTTQMRKAYSTAQKLSKVKPPKPMRPPAMRGRGSGGGGMAAGVAGGVAGVNLGSMLTGAVLKGFGMGWNILKAPFGFIRKGLAERIADEMSDVRAAGGLFSISKRMDSPFVKDFAAAESLTKETNRYLAELAGALPGDTQEYINVSKQISDGIYTVISNDKDNAIKFGQELAKERGADTSTFKGGGAEAMQAAGKELVGEMTKLTVLAGLGGRQGAFGLPQLTEQMISKDKVTLASFSKYAAIFRDPLIKGALERNIEEINKSGKNTTERLKALRATFSEIVTPSLVKRYQRTTEGVIESLKSTFLNPEVGLLGLGRPLNIMATKFDEFGKAVEKDGKVVTEALSLFDYFRDIFANLMIVMEPVFAVIGQLFDPFEKMGMSLQKIRKATMRFQLSFEQFTRFFKDQGDTFSATSIPLRGALSAITEALAKLGVIGQEEIDKFVAIIKDPKAGFKEFGAMLQEMISKFLNSDGAAKIGEAIGGIIGSVVSTVGTLMAQVSGLATSGPLAKGFTDGFNAAGGRQGIKDVFQGIFALLGKAVTELFAAAPLETTAIAGTVLFGPAVLGALTTGFVNKVIPWIVTSLATAFSGTAFAATIAGWLGGVMPALGALGTMITGTLIPGMTAFFTSIGASIAGFGATIGTFVTGTAIPAMGAFFTSIGTFVTGTMIPALMTFLTTIMLPVLAVAGAIMGLVALFRHTDFILSSLLESIKLVWNAFQWMNVKVRSFIVDLMSKILSLLNNLPWPFGGKFKGGSEDAAAQKAKLDTTAAELEEAMGGNLNKIAENTAASWARTKEDAAKLQTMVGLGQKEAKTSADAQITEAKTANVSMKKVDTGMADLYSLLQSGTLNVKMDGGLFGAMGAASAEEKAIGGTAQRFGLTKTSGFRPGDPGWHGVGRAGDYSNASGPTKEMKEFALFLSATVGQNLKELIYTPLGFGIKNGEQVPPYAKGSHMDHVHVAWAGGPQNPAMFDSAIQARQFERSQVGSEIYSPDEVSKNITQNITFNVDGAQDPNAVAEAILSAMQQMEAATIA